MKFIVPQTAQQIRHSAVDQPLPPGVEIRFAKSLVFQSHRVIETFDLSGRLLLCASAQDVVERLVRQEGIDQRSVHRRNGLPEYP